ncbi:MAG: hypothetical protein AB8B61_09910 [Cyclobacteriaceae bacterium]
MVTKARNQIVNKWESTGHIQAAFALKSKRITFENNVFSFTVENDLLVEQLKEYREELLSFLRTECKNSTIQLDIKIDAQEVSENKLYTERDKFNHLLQKHPLLGKLRDELNLDTDL